MAYRLITKAAEAVLSDEKGRRALLTVICMAFFILLVPVLVLVGYFGIFSGGDLLGSGEGKVGIDISDVMIPEGIEPADFDTGLFETSQTVPD